MSKTKIKLKDLPIRVAITKRHKKVWKSLFIITYILFFPIAIIQLIDDLLDFIIDRSITLRNNICCNVFKFIYKKEIIEKEKEFELKCLK